VLATHCCLGCRSSCQHSLQSEAIRAAKPTQHLPPPLIPQYVASWQQAHHRFPLPPPPPPPLPEPSRLREVIVPVHMQHRHIEAGSQGVLLIRLALIHQPTLRQRAVKLKGLKLQLAIGLLAQRLEGVAASVGVEVQVPGWVGRQEGGRRWTTGGQGDQQCTVAGGAMIPTLSTLSSSLSTLVIFDLITPWR
jgi:hypothetical protein